MNRNLGIEKLAKGISDTGFSMGMFLMGIAFSIMILIDKGPNWITVFIISCFTIGLVKSYLLNKQAREKLYSVYGSQGT